MTERTGSSEGSKRGETRRLPHNLDLKGDYMLHAAIIILILISLSIHRYLTVYYEQEILPYPAGFLLSATLLILIYFTGFIWMFGIIAGAIIAILCLMQVTYSTILWAFLLPGLVAIHKQINDYQVPKVNPFVYGVFHILIFLLAALVATNFFVSSYGVFWPLIGDHLWVSIVVSLGVILIGNLARIAVMSKFNN